MLHGRKSSLLVEYVIVRGIIKGKKRNYSVPEHLGLFLVSFSRCKENVQQDVDTGLEILFCCVNACTYALLMLRNPF